MGCGGRGKSRKATRVHPADAADCEGRLPGTRPRESHERRKRVRVAARQEQRRRGVRLGWQRRPADTETDRDVRTRFSHVPGDHGVDQETTVHASDGRTVSGLADHPERTRPHSHCADGRGKDAGVPTAGLGPSDESADASERTRWTVCAHIGPD